MAVDVKIERLILDRSGLARFTAIWTKLSSCAAEYSPGSFAEKTVLPSCRSERMICPSPSRTCASGNASSTIPGEWLSATCSRLNHARTFSMKIGNPLFSGKFDELRSKVSITRRGLSETIIKGVSFEPATTAKFCESIRLALSIDNSPSGRCCMIGWLRDQNVIAGF